jgi:Tfp pilus assembly protein PilV
MTLGLSALVASVLVVLGVFLGYRLSKWQLEARARRQAAAQLFLYRQLHELQAARRKDYAGALSGGDRLQRRVA